MNRIKSIGAALISLALVVALVPEFSRYRAERRLYEADALFRTLIAQGNAAAGNTAMLDVVAAEAMQASAGLAGDSRPLILAGSAKLVEHRPHEALALYRRALGIGERAEIDLNLGRAYALAGNQQAASAAVLRAVWVSPALISVLPEQVQIPLRSALAENVLRLVSHHLATPPALPVDDRSE